MGTSNTSKSGGAEAKRILLVEDDEAARQALAQVLIKAGFEVTSVENGKKAKEIVVIDPFDLVISDIHMPETPVSGIELLQYIKAQTQTPVILMTGFAEISETEEAHKIGAVGFLAKPFKRDDLLALVRQVTGTTETPETQKPVERYCKLSIRDFVSGKQIQHDIFVRLSETKYVKVAHQGENIPMERIEGYRAKGIEFLYMLEEDFNRYIKFNISILGAANKSKTLSTEKKWALLKHTSEVMLEYMHFNEIDRVAMEDARAVVENTVSLLGDESQSLSLLASLEAHSDYLYAHSLGVSLFSSLICRHLKWDSPITLYKVALASMLHDIGKKEIDRAILEKPRIDWTPQDVALYESHPTRGMDILSRVGTIPTEIMQIVHQHHERDLRTGFPLKLGKGKIHPIARLVAVADEFCKLALKNPNNVGMPPREAYRRLVTVQGDALDSNALTALGEILGAVAKKKPASSAA